MTIQGACEWIQDKSLECGITLAPDYPAEVASSVISWSIAYPSSGEIGTASDGWGIDLDNITVLILTQRNDLSEAMKRLDGYPHALARKIQADTTMGGEVVTYGNITYQFVEMDWGGVMCVGYNMTISAVKTHSTF